MYTGKINPAVCNSDIVDKKNDKTFKKEVSPYRRYPL